MLPDQERHEIETVTAFIDKRRRNRCLELLRNPKRRRDFTRELGHFKWLDPRFVAEIRPSDQHPDSIAALLKGKGSPASCWLISEDPDLDAQELPLLQALKEIVGMGTGTIVSCIPGKLGYFEDEDVRYILEKR